MEAQWEARGYQLKVKLRLNISSDHNVCYWRSSNRRSHLKTITGTSHNYNTYKYNIYVDLKTY